MTHGQPANPSSPGPPPARRPSISRNEAIALDLLGVDWGARRIGLAVKPAGQDWPLPQSVLEIADEAQAVKALRATIRERGVGGIVVGLPVHPGGLQASQIKRFCRKVRQGLLGVRWFFVDESLTTQAAGSISSEVRTRRRPTDDLAAALILETFIQSCP